MITSHLPAIQVVAPLLAAPLCMLLHNGRAAWAMATAVSLIALLTAIALLEQVMAGGTISYALGGWPAPLGIEYRIDAVNGFVLVIVAAISLVSLAFAGRSVEEEIDPERRHLFYTSWLLCLAGLLGIAITGDAFNVFVFLEISSLSTYVLISLGRDRRALVASFRYLVMGTIGATFLLIGIGLLYMVTGTLNMQDIAARLPAALDTRTAQVAFAFTVIGIGIKAAVFPLHVWLPNAYAYAPSAVSVMIAGTSTKVAVYALMRFVFTIFGADYAFEVLEADRLLLAFAVLGIFATSLVAVFQNDVKRMLAWSSVAQIGYMMVGIALATQTALTGSIVHLFNHAVMKAALFMAMGAVMLRLGSVQLQDMEGIGRHMPYTMGAFLVGGLGLIGVPPTVGFISKWYLVLGAIESGNGLLAVLILLSSLLALVYVWRVIETAFLRPSTPQVKALREAPISLLVPTWVLIVASIYFGIDTQATVGVATEAAGTLLGARP